MKRLSSIALISLLFFACQKDLSYQDQANTAVVAAPAADNSSIYYVKFNNGKDVETYRANTIAFLGDAGTARSLVLKASSNDDLNAESINLYLSFLSGSPAVGTYKQGDAAFKYLVSGAYNPGNAEFTYSAGLTRTTEQPLTITITSIESGVIKGTFKGAFYKHNLATGIMSETDYLDYREGEFNLPFN